MENVAQLAKKIANLMRKEGVENYDQTKNVFREVRRQLDLTQPTRKGRGTVKRLSTEQLRDFLEQAHRHSATRGLMIQTLYEAALRVSEFVNLRVEDFYYDQRRLVVKSGKGDKRREVPITPALANLLRIHINDRDQGPIFRSRQAGPFTTRRIRQIIDEVGQAANIKTKVYPHLLRHTRATLLVESGMTNEQLQPMLGHENPNTTHIYTRTAGVLTNEAYNQAARKANDAL